MIFIIHKVDILNFKSYSALTVYTKQWLRPYRPLGALEEGELNLITQFFILDFKRKKKKIGGRIFWEERWYPSPKQLYPFPGPTISYHVKENLIGSAVSERERERETFLPLILI